MILNEKTKMYSAERNFTTPSGVLGVITFVVADFFIGD
jgi:hypothetical protein